ncbi:MAG: hypothetical protein ABSC13_10515 [Dehalococcoidia bacterium]|jgi:hypothetical protein
MTQPIVLKSLDELGRFGDRFAATEQTNNDRPMPPATIDATPELDLDALMETVRRAAQEITTLAAADADVRQEAEQALARYRRLQSDAALLQDVSKRAQVVADKASAIAAQAFVPKARVRAEEIAARATTLADGTRNRLVAIQAEVAVLAVDEGMGRLLAEERAKEEEARREAEERRREARLREGISQAESLARDQKFDEALRLLGRLATEQPNSPDLASLADNIRRRAWAVKTVEVEKALREARRVCRREPRQALELLEPLDLSDMPQPLVRQVYGCWLQTCRRLNLDRAVHYSPALGRGAILVAADDGRLEVVSAIGVGRWKAGCRFSAAALKGARPLS